MAIIRRAGVETGSRYQTPFNLLLDSAKYNFSNDRVRLGGDPSIEVAVEQGTWFSLPRDRTHVFSRLAPAMLTALDQPVLRDMYERQTGITIEHDFANGFATFRQRGRPDIRIFTSYALGVSEKFMQSVPVAIGTTIGGLFALPAELSGAAARRGLISVDTLETRQIGIAVPLLKLVTRGLKPQEIQNWWQDIFPRRKTWVVVNPNGIQGAENAEALSKLMRDIRPVGAITRGYFATSVPQ